MANASQVREIAVIAQNTVASRFTPDVIKSGTSTMDLFVNAVKAAVNNDVVDHTHISKFEKEFTEFDVIDNDQEYGQAPFDLNCSIIDIDAKVAFDLLTDIIAATYIYV